MTITIVNKILTRRNQPLLDVNAAVWMPYDLGVWMPYNIGVWQRYDSTLEDSQL